MTAFQKNTWSSATRSCGSTVRPATTGESCGDMIDTQRRQGRDQIFRKVQLAAPC